MFPLNYCVRRINPKVLALSLKRPQYIQLINYHIQHMLKYSSNRCNPCDPCDPCGSGGGGSGKSGKHHIAYKPYVPPCHQDHDHKNMALRRPMSPHLQIYAPTLPAMTSIAQRITGAVLTFYALVLSGGVLFLPNGIDSIVSMIQSLNLPSTLIMIIKFIVGYPFCYHYFIGIRFCIWSLGKMMTLDAIYKSAYASILASCVLAVLFAMR